MKTNEKARRARASETSWNLVKHLNGGDEEDRTLAFAFNRFNDLAETGSQLAHRNGTPNIGL